MGMFFKALFLGAIAYGAVCLAVFIFQDKLVFHPSKPHAGTPANIGLDYEDVLLTAPGGQGGPDIHGWYLPAPPRSENPATVLFLHGNAGNISHRMQTMTMLHRLGYATLILDYPGFGRSEGRPSEEGTYATAEAGWRHLTEVRNVEPGDIVLFGRSLGAAPALWLAGRTRPAAIIVEASFTSIIDMAMEVYPFLPVRYLARIRYPNQERIASVNAPVLVTHGRGDGTVPFKQGLALFEAAPTPKRFLELEGGHNDGFLATGPVYERVLTGFVAAARGKQDWSELDPAALTRAPR